jgi:HAD superfamily hydrolase (TIGR01509 family)
VAVKSFAFGGFREPIRGVILDGGDVLFDDTLWGRWLLQVLRRVGVQASYRDFHAAWDERYVRDVCSGRRSLDAVLADTLRCFGLARGQIDEVRAAACAKRRELEHSVRLLPGVRCALVRLRATGVALAVLCNSEHPSEVLRDRLARCGLENLFSGVVSSLDLGRVLPDPACYHAALRTLGLPGDLCAFVGHKAEELAGAQNAALHTVAFNCAADAVAEVFLDRFDDLFGLVVSSGRSGAAG